MKILCRWTCVLGAIAMLAGCANSEKPLTDKQRGDAAKFNAQLGLDYFRQGNLNMAKEKIDRALEQNPRSVQANMAAGFLYDRLGDPGKADNHFNRAVELNPENPDLLNNYAVFLCRKGDRAKGEQLAAKAAANPLYKTPEAALLNAGLCALGEQHVDRAEKYFRRSLALRPNFAEALYRMAELEMNAGNFMPARGFLQRYMQAAPLNPSALWLGVRIEKGLGNTATAGDYARRLKNDFPTADETKALIESERQPG